MLILTNQIAGIFYVMIFYVITFTLRHNNDYTLISLAFYRSYFWRECKTLKWKLTFEVSHITNTKRCNICWNNFSVVRSSSMPNNQVLPDKGVSSTLICCFQKKNFLYLSYRDTILITRNSYSINVLFPNFFFKNYKNIKDKISLYHFWTITKVCDNIYAL